MITGIRNIGFLRSSRILLSLFLCNAFPVSGQETTQLMDLLQENLSNQGPAPMCLPGATDHYLAEQLTLASPLPNDDPSQARSFEIEEKDRTTASGEQVKEVTLKNFLIDKIYPSMYGPWKRHHVKLYPASKEPYVWITGYRAEVLDSNTGVASQEFMCHTNLDLVGTSENPFGYVKSQLSISQGQKEIRFPQGFGLRIPNDEYNKIDVNGMVLNNNYTDMHKYLDFKASIFYLGDSEAQRRDLIPLKQTSVFNTCRTTGDRALAWAAGSTAVGCERASSTSEHSGATTGHWVVHPGRHIYKSLVTSQLNLDQDTSVHYMWVHVHPFAESVELIDETSGESLWLAKVESNPFKAAVNSTESFSSVEGLTLFKDHEYSLSTVYDNPKDTDTDAMAAIWMYVR